MEYESEESTAPLDVVEAKRLETLFQQGVGRKLSQVVAIGDPLQGNVYDVDYANEFQTGWKSQEEARRQLYRSGRDLGIDDLPHNPVSLLSIVRKPLFGNPTTRLSVLWGCWSPLADVLHETPATPANLDVIETILESAQVYQRPDIYFYVGVASLSGWDFSVTSAIPEGPNFDCCLIEPFGEGWKLTTNADWPIHVRDVFNPEETAATWQRVARILKNSPELTRSGGMLLIEEVADISGVPEADALEMCAAFCEEHPEFVLEEVRGSMIVRNSL